MIRSKTLVDRPHKVLMNGKEFAYDHVMRHKVVTFKRETDSLMNRQ